MILKVSFKNSFNAYVQKVKLKILEFTDIVDFLINFNCDLIK